MSFWKKKKRYAHILKWHEPPNLSKSQGNVERLQLQFKNWALFQLPVCPVLSEMLQAISYSEIVCKSRFLSVDEWKLQLLF